MYGCDGLVLVVFTTDVATINIESIQDGYIHVHVYMTTAIMWRQR